MSSAAATASNKGTKSGRRSPKHPPGSGRTPSSAGNGAGNTGPTDGGNMDSSVRVVVRVRPQNKKETENGGSMCVSFPSEDSIELHDAKKTYDRVFDPSATQQEVFHYVAKPLVKELFNGYNGTIFAYGQTSSGKTHTMEGPSIHDPDLAGVIPRTVREIFECVTEASDSVEFVIKVSYIEIYMEKIRDLLDSYQTKVNLPVREDKKRGVYVAGATEEYVTSADELIAVMAAGAKNRVTAATGMNQGSSRSHSVFIISLQQRDVNDSSTKTGMLFLVDLAGSEMVKKTHATGKVLEEAKTINKSLSALGQVINALTDEKKPHVPYRDSKLTRVLQNSLGGNSKTCLIVNCSPSSFNEAETQSTLRFGSRAKRIQNKAVVNETRSVEELGALLAKAEATFEMQQTYIAALEKQLTAMKKSVRGEPDAPRPPPSPAGEASTETGDQEAASPDSGEAASAIRRLTEANQALQAEVEEEKAEVKRREKETNDLRQVLQERERQLRDAADELSQLGKTHQVRLEALAAEKASLDEELEGAKAKLQEAVEANRFEQEERSFTIEQLTKENARLANEIGQLTGDAVQPTRPRTPTPAAAAATDAVAAAAAAVAVGAATLEPTTESSATAGAQKAATQPSVPLPPPAAAAAAAGDGELASPNLAAGVVGAVTEARSDDSVAPAAAAGAAAAAGQVNGGDALQAQPEELHEVEEGGGEAGRTAAAATSVLVPAVAAGVGGGSPAGERDGAKAAVPRGGMEDWDPAVLESAGATASVLDIVRAREEAWRLWQSSLLQENWKPSAAAGGETRIVVKELDKKQADPESVRWDRLAEDLQKVALLRQQLESSNEAKGESDATLAAERREKAAIQTRLEQLVAVHRALLRRYGSMELENAEARKQLHLRSGRMTELERQKQQCQETIKSQRVKMNRQSAELLLVKEELTESEKLRKRMQQAPHHVPGERRAIRGGGADHQVHEVKTLRGGGGRRSHDEAQPWGGSGLRVEPSAPISPAVSGSGFTNGDPTPPKPREKVRSPNKRRSFLSRLTSPHPS